VPGTFGAKTLRLIGTPWSGGGSENKLSETANMRNFKTRQRGMLRRPRWRAGASG
jgi:hypothetical protein